MNGYKLNWVTSFFGPKPYTAGDGMRHLAITAEKAGVHFFYNLPAEQLVQSKTGEVLGVIARAATASIQVHGQEGCHPGHGRLPEQQGHVRLLCTRCKELWAKQMGKTGDGL